MPHDKPMDLSKFDVELIQKMRELKKLRPGQSLRYATLFPPGCEKEAQDIRRHLGCFRRSLAKGKKHRIGQELAGLSFRCAIVKRSIPWEAWDFVLVRAIDPVEVLKNG